MLPLRRNSELCEGVTMTSRVESDQASAAAEAWVRLTTRYLPVVPELGGWRYSRHLGEHEPTQGWKLHVSTTLPNAVATFERCAPVLARDDVLFKSVKTLRVLAQLNSGIPFGFSQVGKFMTVYPTDESHAISLASRLHELTADLAAPAVPFDRPCRQRGCVYYRYGAFGPQEVELEDGQRVGAVRDSAGELVPDLREPGKAVPSWLTDPFPAMIDGEHAATPLHTDFLCFEAMMQRGKGGVYRALNLLADPVTRCVIKEGRRQGETGWDGTDGRDLVEREHRVLDELRHVGFGTPRVIGAFVIDEHRYLAMEHIDGQSLLSACADPERKLSLDLALAYSAATAQLVAKLHALGWVWRDCKPANLIVSNEGALRPIDFEGAVRRDGPSTRPWGTPGFSAPEWREPRGSNLPEDLFALGATIHQLCTSWLMHRNDTSAGATPQDVTRRPPLGTLRKGVPSEVRGLVSELMATDPDRRPPAAVAAKALRAYAMDTLPVPEQIDDESATVRSVREKLWRQARELVIDNVLPAERAA